MSDGFLHRYFMNNGGRLLHKWYHYFDIYEAHFSRFRDKAPVVLEIGVSGGGSLEMWHAYFGAGSHIIGLDINPACADRACEGSEIVIGSQDDPVVLQGILDRHPRIDIVIDDGSHLSPHMKATFDFLYERISPTGVYLLEDTHCNYWPEMDGGVGRPGTFMEYAKAHLDHINARHCRGELPILPLTKSTFSITCYDSIIAYERRPQGQRKPVSSVAMDDETLAIPF